MKKTAISFCLIIFTLSLAGQNKLLPVASAARTSIPPRIDGILVDSAWKDAPVISGFRQYIPVYEIKESFSTQVRILYDNEAIYLAARMFDLYPDSILSQMGNRDEEDLNADYFAFGFDTYNHQLDAYNFVLYASGVQADSRKGDDTYDAVWQSEVNKDSIGWTAEIKIPYSAIRFPSSDIQNWRLQLKRYIRRYRELDMWALVVKEAPNELVYWGELKGIEKVKPVIRLSLTPYLSAIYENYPLKLEDTDDNSNTFTGGMDLKYGLNESYTLDMSLLPDFSQVQSDNQEKNLSAFEIVYEEQRPFFKEAVDLFERGDLFYSRRIGRIPLGYYSIKENLSPGEKIIKNPMSARLINATKLSGRNEKGLALGIFNAVTDNTYATVEDSSGRTKKVLTDPRSNYNIIVIDKDLKNNSSVYLINTNVIRDKAYNNANVTGAGMTVFDKNNNFKVDVSGAVSQLYYKAEGPTHQADIVSGIKYDFSAAKVKGRYQVKIYSNGMDDRFSANDMGVTLYNNTMTHGFTISKYQFEPVGISRESTLSLNYELEQNFRNGKPIEAGFHLNSYSTLMNYLSLWNEVSLETTTGYDFYEPRSPGRYYIKPRYFGLAQGLSSDYRKPFALDMNLTYYYSGRDVFDLYELSLEPRIRLNDHLFFTYSFRWVDFKNDIGFAGQEEPDNIIFGKRDVREVENAFSGRYMFKNNLSLNLRFRHYWSTGVYSDFYTLLQDGKLSDVIPYNKNCNFNFNAFTVDLVLWWEFAPGSRLNLIWKNVTTVEKGVVVHDFWKNLNDTWDAPQDNTITIKFLYYFDYQYLKKNKQKSS